MNKNLQLLALFFVLTISLYAQDKNNALLEEFNRIGLENQTKFQQLNKFNKARTSEGESIEYLAGFFNNTPYFYTQDDRRANMASNIENLQNGEVGGVKIDGEGITIMVMDGGRVFEKHGEFIASRIIDSEHGALSYNAHATSVAGFIASGGHYNLNEAAFPNVPKQFSKGVIPKALIKSYGFTTTVNGTNFSKIIKAQENISNHSYGINVGWSYKDEKEGSNGAGWYFPQQNYAPNDPKATFGGSYYTNDAQYDKIVYNNPSFIIVKSAGNYFGSGPSDNDSIPAFKANAGGYVPFEPGENKPKNNCANGAYCIGWGSLAKNIIVVAATEMPTDFLTYQFTGPLSIKRASFSSAGPRKDGAIKPDIAAVGHSVFSPTYSAATPSETTLYSSGSGTSYSAPKVTGAIGALTQLKRKLTNNADFVYKADEMRALLLHNTLEAGQYDGPDNWFGWGFLDAKKTAEFIVDAENKKSLFVRERKESGEEKSKIVVAEGGELKVSLSWIDPEGTASTKTNDLFYDTSSKLINDFDVRVIDLTTNEIFLPWKLDLANPTGAAIKGDNTVDNIEQIQIKNAVKGRQYKVVITNKGKLVNAFGTEIAQHYVLAVSGIAHVTTEQTNETDEFFVYPSVAKNVVNIRTNQKIQLVEIFDISGKLIISQTTDMDLIPVHALSSGVYILRTTTNKGVITKKFIKN